MEIQEATTRFLQSLISTGLHPSQDTGKSCQFIQKRQVLEKKTKRELSKREKRKAYKSSLRPLLMRGRFPFIRESDGRRDTACAEGNQKAVMEQCVYTHAHILSTLLSFGGVPVERQMN